MEIFWIPLSEKFGGESQNFKAEWFMSCLGCCHMVAQHWLESWNTHHPFPSPPEGIPGIKSNTSGSPKVISKHCGFCSVQQGGFPLVSTNSMDRILPRFLGRWLVGWGRWIWDYRLLFSNMELWYVLGILKKVSWEASLGVLWSFRSHFTPEFSKRWEKFSFLR